MMLGYPPVKCVNKSSLGFLINELVQNEFYIFQLKGDKIYDLISFYNECIEVLPQDPPLTKKEGHVNLDAFADSILGGLAEQEVDKVAILWKDANNIVNNNLNDLLKITQLFYELSMSFKEANGWDGSVELLVFLADYGKNFPSFNRR